MMKLGATKIAAIGLVTLAGLGTAMVSGIGRPDDARAQTSGAESGLGITVTGTGSVEQAPDKADFSFGVETQGSTADEALERNNAAVQKVIDALKGAGVAQADIQTQQVSVSPRYGNDGTTVTGYAATNSVDATIRELSKAGAVVDAAVKAGANQVYGPTLSIADKTELYSAALEKAVADARSKAETLAGAAGVSLGRIVNIVEGGAAGPPIPYAAAAAEGDQSVPIEPGVQEIQASISVTFAIA
jgi:uncharacterized protein